MMDDHKTPSAERSEEWQSSLDRWRRIERKVDRLTWMVVIYLAYQLVVAYLLVWKYITLLIGILAIGYVLMLTPAMRAMFPSVGRRLLALHRWFFRRSLS